ncbi:MAG: hypothetical protein V4709_02475 [Pseudomonadota bacterium]
MSDDLWGPISLAAWQAVPCISGRLATEAYVKAGRAVFYLRHHEDHGGAPYYLPLPHCAVWLNAESGQSVSGVIVQAEHGDGQVLVGFRPLSGGNVVALLPEFCLLNNPTEFTQ